MYQLHCLQRLWAGVERCVRVGFGLLDLPVLSGYCSEIGWRCFLIYNLLLINDLFGWSAPEGGSLGLA
jgi:hypothetical protein